MKKIVYTHLLNLGFLLYLEFLFQILVFKEFNITWILNILLYTIFASIFITILTNIFNPKVNKVLLYITYSILPILYSIQLVFKNIFNAFFSLSLLSLSDQVLSFGSEAVGLIFENILFIILFFIPLIILIIFRKRIPNFKLRDTNLVLIEIFILCFSIGLFHIYLNTSKNEYLSGYSLYYEVRENSLNIKKLGVLNSYKLDLVRTIFGFEEKVNVVPSDTDKEEDNKDKEEIKEYSYNKEDLNLERIKNKSSFVYNYINNNDGTRQNEYTGIFKGKNLIYIVAESFDEIGISKELTPTLYKLANSSFIFENFYTPNYLSTIGGEFQALTGLHPSQELLKTWRNGTNTYPYGLANIYKDLGYKTFAYHDHSGYFQDRYKYIKSLGFDNFKACNMGLNINCKRWPESDIEMINATVDEYLNSPSPFMVYYMTVSGHFEYTFSGNSIASKNKSLVDSLPYSESIKAYIATQIELDKALEILLNKLDSANKLDDTVIVMMADHYPYALTLDEMNEVSTYKRDNTFEINHNKLIIYNSKLENINVKKVAASPDVLPTVYNLFGINYDSRLFTGSDILSTNDGLVIFQDRSWISDKAIYNSSTNTYEAKDKDVTREYIDKINNIVSNKLSFSKEVINNNYYIDILGN